MFHNRDISSPSPISTQPPNKTTTMTTSSGSPFYFELPEAELKHLPKWGPHETRLLSAVIAALRTGLEVHNRKSNLPTSAIDTSTYAGKETEKFIALAARDHFHGDKFMALRLTGPSLTFIRSTLPSISTMPKDQKDMEKVILRLCLWRAFAVGCAAHLKEITFVGKAWEPSEKELADIVKSWIKKSKLSMPVYGQLMIEGSKVSLMISQFSALGKDLATLSSKNKAALTFETVYNKIADAKIPYIPKGGLLVWLMTSDLSEYAFCTTPKVEDLCKHMELSSTSGPKKAVERAWGTTAKEKDIEKTLAQIMNVLEDPPAKMAQLIETVQGCEKAQGRCLNVVDLEHALCKVARMYSSAEKGTKKRKRMVEE